jgi:hypothetical protein
MVGGIPDFHSQALHKLFHLHFMVQFPLKSGIPMKSGNPQTRVCQENSLLFFKNSYFLHRHKVLEVLLEFEFPDRAFYSFINQLNIDFL